MVSIELDVYSESDSGGGSLLRSMPVTRFLSIEVSSRSISFVSYWHIRESTSRRDIQSIVTLGQFVTLGFFS